MFSYANTVLPNVIEVTLRTCGLLAGEVAGRQRFEMGGP